MSTDSLSGQFMRALKLVAYNDLQVREVPIPQIGDNDVLFKVAACGICGSDVKGQTGQTGRRDPGPDGLTMGHEAVGTVVAVGRNVTNVQVGERIVVDSTVFCGECPNCRDGRSNLCSSARVLGVAPLAEGWREEGCFAEFALVPSRICFALPEEVSWDAGALVEPFAVARQAIRDTISKSRSAVVIGVGLIGLATVAQLKKDGYRVAAVNRGQTRLDKAIELGAIGFLQDDPCVAQKIVEAVGDTPVVFEVVGDQSTVSLAQSLCQNRGSELVLVGNMSKTAALEFNVQQLVTKGMVVRGSKAFDRGCIPEALEFLRGFDVSSLVSGHCSLDDAPEVFHRLLHGGGGEIKYIVTPNGSAMYVN